MKKIFNPNKKGFYFVVDAFLASSVVIVTLILIYSLSISQGPKLQTQTLSSDFMNVISTTDVDDYTDSYVIDLIKNGTITNPELSLLEQIGYFYYYYNKTGSSLNLSEKFTRKVATNLIPTQYSITIAIDDGISEIVIFDDQIRKEEEKADILIPSRKIIFGVINESTTFGPYVITVKVWE